MSDVIVGLAFGLRGNKPGVSNERIARYTWYWSREPSSKTKGTRTPIIAQEEVAVALKEKAKEFLVESIPGNFPGRENEGYSDTYSVATEVKKIVEREGWKNSITLICHPAHRFRAQRVFKKLGFKVHVPKSSTGDIPYDPQSSQPWTRNKWLFWPREIFAILIYKIKGYI